MPGPTDGRTDNHGHKWTLDNVKVAFWAGSFAGYMASYGFFGGADHFSWVAVGRGFLAGYVVFHVVLSVRAHVVTRRLQRNISARRRY